MGAVRDGFLKSPPSKPTVTYFMLTSHTLCNKCNNGGHQIANNWRSSCCKIAAKLHKNRLRKRPVTNSQELRHTDFEKRDFKVLKPSHHPQ